MGTIEAVHGVAVGVRIGRRRLLREPTRARSGPSGVTAASLGPLLVSGWLVCLAPAAANAQSVIWLNETDTVLECDFCNLQFPASVMVAAGETTPPLFGQIFEAGTTESPGDSGGVLAEVGFGPSGSNPIVDPGWQWFAASYNAQIGNNDEYVGALTVPTAGAYSYTFRYSLDAGSSATAGDLDGAGANFGLDFSPASLGTLTVTGGPGPSVPSLGVPQALLLGVALLAVGLVDIWLLRDRLAS